MKEPNKLKDIKPEELHGKRVILRLDLNLLIDLKTGEVSDDYRLKRACRRLNIYGTTAPARLSLATWVMMVQSLAPVLALLQNNLPIKWESPDDWFGVMDELLPGEIYLLENIRRDGEMKRPSVCEKLADGRYFVNDALPFHREHASLWAFPNLPWIYGFLFEEEVANFLKF